MARCSKSTLAFALVFAVAGASSCDKPSSSSGGGGAAGPAVVGGYDRTDLGTRHVYQIGTSGTLTMEVVGVTPTGFTRRSQTEGDTSYQELEYEVVNGGEYYGRSSTFYNPGVATYDYSPVTVMLPGDVTPGAVTTTVSSVTGSATYTLTRAATVNGVESVTVPAGTFQALKVTAIITDSRVAGTFTSEMWWAPGVGRVKSVGYATGSLPSIYNTLQLRSVSGGTAPPASGSLNGSYDTSAIRCNGTAAPSPIADLIAAPHSMTFLVAGSAGNITWSDLTCSIVQPVGFAFPSAGNVTLTVAGPFGCYPDPATCAALSASTFGAGVCGQTDLQGPRTYTFSPTSPVASGQSVNLVRVGGNECATLASSTDPISYVLTKQ